MGSAHRDRSKIFVTACPSSKSGAAVNQRLRYRSLPSVYRTIFIPSASFVFPKAKTQYVYCCLIQFFIIFAEMIMIWLCLATSMIELFMLDLVMVMIYLFRNLIMQLPHYSTICPSKRTDYDLTLFPSIALQFLTSSRAYQTNFLFQLIIVRPPSCLQKT